MNFYVDYNTEEKGMSMQELWKDLKRFDNLYQVSNKGRVRSLIHNVILKPANIAYRNQEKSNGYQVVNIKKKIYYVHRLVAEEFIPNPDNLPQINHKDGNKQNNNVENLEWCTNSENMSHAYRLGLICRTKSKCSKNQEKWREIFGKKYHATKANTIFKEQWFKEKYIKPNQKAIIQLDKNGNKIKEWESMKLAGEKLNISKQNISACCRGIRKTAGGFIWKYKI